MSKRSEFDPDKGMKLLTLFPSTLRGGTEEYALTIASGANRAGWKVHVAFPQTPETASLIGDFRSQGIHYHPLDIASIARSRFQYHKQYTRHFFRTVSLLKRLKPEVVHLNIPLPDSGFGSILACGWLNIPTAVTFHMMFQLSIRRKRLKAYHWARSRNQEWIAISDNNRWLTGESFGIPSDRIRLIYNGTKIRSNIIDLNSDAVAELRSQVRREIGAPENSRLLLTVGRLVRTKGYKELIEVVPRIVQEFPEARFVWVGEGDMHEILLTKRREYGVEDKVHLLGYRSDVPRLMRAADLFVFPTYFEGFPLCLLEAMAHGLPIVASDTSSIPEMIENQVQGLLFPKEDAQAVLEEVRYALQHPEKMREMAQRAKARVQNFSEEKMVGETLRLLGQMASYG